MFAHLSPPNPRTWSTSHAWLNQPPGVRGEIRHHQRCVTAFDRDVFTGGLGERVSRSVVDRALGFQYPTFAICHQFARHNDFLIRREGLEIPHVEFRAEGELPRRNNTSPDHDLIQHCGRQSAVHNAFESDVFWARAELGRHHTPVSLKPQLQSEWV